MPSRLRLVTLAGLVLSPYLAFAVSPLGRFILTDSGDTVSDSRTGLVWQRAINAAGNWFDGRSYCLNSTGLPGSGWRLPSIEELLTLVDTTRSSPAIDDSWFPDTPVAAYWSSTPSASSTNDAWALVLDYGNAHRFDKSNAGAFRCVR